MLRTLALICLLAMPQIARAQQTPPPAPDRPFQLVLFYDGANAEESRAAWNTMTSRASEEMRRWNSLAIAKRIDVRSPIMREHHGDVLRDATGFPAIAFVDGQTGARWALFSGKTLPRDSKELAAQLSIIWAATIQAAKEAGVDPVQVMDRDSFAQTSMQPSFDSDGYYDVGSAPIAGPFNRDGSFLNPSINASVSAETGLNAETRKVVRGITWGLGGSAVFLGLCIVAGFWIYTEGVTSQPEGDGRPGPPLNR